MTAIAKFEAYLKDLPPSDCLTNIYVSPKDIKYRDGNSVPLFQKEYDKEANAGNPNIKTMQLARFFRALDSSLNYAVICLLGCSETLQRWFIPAGLPSQFIEKRYEMAEYLQKQHGFSKFSFKDELNAMAKELEDLPYKGCTTRDISNITIRATTSLSIFLGLTVMINKKYGAAARWFPTPTEFHDIDLRDTKLGQFIEALLN